MPRRTRKEALQTRDDIVRAGLKVFLQKGFSRTTIEDIARVAGVTRGAVYHHFSGKVAIFEVLYNRIDIQLIKLYLPVALTGKGSLDRLRKAFLRSILLFAEQEEAADIWELVTQKMELTEELEPLASRIRKEDHKLVQTLRLYLALAARRGELRKDIDPAHAAMGLYNLWCGILDSWFFLNREYSLQETAPAVVQVYFDGLKQNRS